MKEARTGDTICDMQHPILLEPIRFAEAVVSRSIEPQSSADKQKLIDTLNLLIREDPTSRLACRCRYRANIDQRHGCAAPGNQAAPAWNAISTSRCAVSKPRVNYKETLRDPVRIVGECVKQAGTAGLFGKVTVEFEPYKGDGPISVVNKLKPETLTPLYVAAAEQGIRGALQSGELGYPVMNVRATIIDGEMDLQFSNETAFQAAGADAVHKALRDNMVLLEPVMHLEVTVPEEHLGPITADLNSRRAEIKQLLMRGKLRVIEALVPLRLMFDYADKARSLSQGRASYTMEPCSYAPAPDEVLRRLLGSGDDSW